MTKLPGLEDYRLLGNSGLRVSPFCLGTMTFGTELGSMGNTFEESKKLFDYYVENGGNFIDTANIYMAGTSERWLGEMIGQHRSKLVLATKYSSNPHLFRHLPRSQIPQRLLDPNMGGNQRKSLVQNLAESLQRMQVDAIDLFYMHVYDFRTPSHEWLRAMDDVVRSGKVHYVAISDTPAWVISSAQTEASLRGWSQLIALQTRYNLLDRSMEGDLGPMARANGLGIITWGALAEGFLSGKHTRDGTAEGSGRAARVNQHGSVAKNWDILDEVRAVAAEVGRPCAQVALNWICQKPGVTAPLVGAKNVEQLQENLDALTFKLSSEQIARLDKVSAYDLPFPHSMASFGWTTGAFDNIEKRYF